MSHRHHDLLELAVRSFIRKCAGRYPITGAVLYGSMARGTNKPESDIDVAILLRGKRNDRFNDVSLDMAGIAFDVMLETDVLLSLLPIWTEEWEHPETYTNPQLLENIRRDGVSISI